MTERWESLRGWGETYAYKTGSDNGFSSGYAAGLDAARAAVVAVEENPKAEVDYERDYTADSSGETRNPRIWVREAVAAIEAIDDTRQANQHQTLDPHEGERHE
ncbi:MAG TPA: hypothetical protein VLA24_11525 [Pseudomonadales bacterium]|nr:hypothetical protein [Pseudomonadales bacterium]